MIFRVSVYNIVKAKHSVTFMYICISVIKIIVTILVIIGDKWYVFIVTRYKTYHLFSKFSEYKEYCKDRKRNFKELYYCKKKNWQHQ